AAAQSLGMNYLGFDPNVGVQRGHTGIYEHMRDGTGTGTAIASTAEGGATSVLPQTAPERATVTRVIYQGFEHAEPHIQAFVASRGLFDVVHSSPPFFDLELYPGDNQSVTQWTEFDA